MKELSNERLLILIKRKGELLHTNMLNVSHQQLTNE